MAKAQTEVTVLPPEAFIAFAAVAMHALIPISEKRDAAFIARQSFDVAEAMRNEARKRGYLK